MGRLSCWFAATFVIRLVCSKSVYAETLPVSISTAVLLGWLKVGTGGVTSKQALSKVRRRQAQGG